MAGEKILVVDDNKAIRDSFLTALESYEIITASCATEALNLLKRLNDIDLIVTDVMMPDMNGLELLGKIKEINSYAKVVIMTAYSSKDIAIEALRARADEYLEKPFDINKAKEIFERLLKDGRELNGSLEKSGDRKIKLAKRLINRNYNKSLSLHDISSELFLNYKYFSRLFKEKSGKGFARYKLELRMTQAKQLLKKRSDTVSQIAYKVGYHNPDSFMKIFKRFTGFTPSQYRNNHT